MSNNGLQRERAPRAYGISRRFSHVLIVIITLMLIVFAVVAMVINTGRVALTLESRLNSYLKLAEVSLATPLWNLNDKAVEGFVDSLFIDPAVVYARIIADDEVVVERARTPFQKLNYLFFTRPNGFFSEAADISHDGEVIGLLQLAASRGCLTPCAARSKGWSNSCAPPTPS